MTDRDKLVEIVRDAILSTADCCAGGIVNSDAIAHAALAAIEEAGWAVVPHTSDCSIHNEPALPKGKCDCWVLSLSSPIDP